MTAPLPLRTGELAGLALALCIGIAFGAGLERGGMASARKLAGQFYLTDFAVFKVMFSAIVTAMLGVFWLSRLGLLDPARVYVPETWILPQAVGGVVFGVGFVAAGLCPGTSCVAAASGRRDGAAVLLGVLGGTVVYGAVWPWVGDFAGATARGPLTLPQATGLPWGVVVAGVVGCALAGFAVAERLERRAGTAHGGSDDAAG